MTPPTPIDPRELRESLAELGLDGWLCYDFHGINPIVHRVITLQGMVTRRVFVWLPATGTPRAVVHNIDRGSVAAFAGEVEEYTTWQELHQALGALVSRRRVAMEISPENSVPYLDWVPAGVVGLLEKLGAQVVSSAPLVTRFASRWSASELADHRAAAEALAEIAHTTLTGVIRQVGRATEVGVQRTVLGAMAAAGLITVDPPIVAFGPNSANPHYAPRPGNSATLQPDQVVLLDLWGRRSTQTVWADQTWMAFSGATPPAEVARVWEATRDARDAVVDRLQAATRARKTVTGAALDDAARDVLRAQGYGDAFVHRTGHSIGLELHGSGPNLDNFETRDLREIIPGVAFSVEPGVYLAGRFGMRSEINVIQTADGPEVTPRAPQTRLLLAD